MNKVLENILTTIPVWGMVGVMTLEIATAPKPKHVYVNNTEYAIFSDASQTRVHNGTMSSRDIIDRNKDGIVDIYTVKTGAPRRGVIMCTHTGKDIPKSVQEEYTRVINQ